MHTLVVSRWSDGMTEYSISLRDKAGQNKILREIKHCPRIHALGAMMTHSRTYTHDAPFSASTSTPCSCLDCASNHTCLSMVPTCSQTVSSSSSSNTSSSM